jgi:hypothetical protein
MLNINMIKYFSKIKIKKMFKITLYLIFFNTINAIDFCIRNEKKICSGIYDESNLKYTENCVKIACRSPFSYDCKDYCTINRGHCKLLNWRLSNLFDSSPNKNSITNCFITKIKSSDFCLNGENCLLHITLGEKNLTSKMRCKCPEEKSFACGKYCTRDNLKCKEIENLKTKLHNLEYCGNANINYFIEKPKYFADAKIF